MSQIELEQVCKSFTLRKRQKGWLGAVRGAFTRDTQTIRAVDNVSFTVDEGELVGYIGSNGAGKSTTIKMMSGILTPDSGRVSVMGRVPWRERVRHVASIGVVFGQRSQLWWDTPVIDSFELLRDIYRVSPTDYRRRLDDLTALLDATSLLNTPVRQLSLGQRMKCEFIGALLHGPRILFLDEPTIGLDAVTKLALRDFLIDLNRREGVTMLLTTHDMDDVEALCRRVMVIGKGRLLFSGGMDALRARYAPHRIIRARLAEDRAQLDLIGAQSVTLNGRDALITFLPEKTPAEQMIARLAAACPLADLTVEAPDIDHLVAEMYARMGMTT
ncbi:MAG: ATP-binding cassette domain-containing protein [Clostridiales bacterium]|nr:ATP-binding cassette domain-containing protein [Clostridiales bacterium]